MTSVSLPSASERPTPVILSTDGPESTVSQSVENTQPTFIPSPTDPLSPTVDLYEDDIIVRIAEDVLSSVVGIHVEAALPGTNLGSVSEGSGLVMTADGYIVTNNHVIDQVYDAKGERLANSVISVFITQNTSPYQAVIVGRDVQTDLALLKIEAAELVPAKFW